ncbi:substrate-binding domain-containing protein [Sphingomonas sp. RIT328]|uniref:substrate-binding domain-containing protein n=1 Tax=Sphingomonas sp. RIT328 TaxID=1470591 RepID=UPI00044BC59E|nr:substrate-binding domain-containing protein [Sphingomonas sp. RIT328]EZP50033.1 Transcriptional regulator, LacI family [Sphingomonas sp. RIT328]
MATIADLAGVSKITVSRALSGSELVRPELRERIVEVAREAGYRMNVAARALRTRRSRTIALVIERLVAGDRPISDPLILAIIGGLLETLTPAGQAMLVTSSDHFLDGQVVDADGIVMVGQGVGGERARIVAAQGLPMVAWGERLPNSGMVVIGSDNRSGGRLSARHLVDTGRRRLIFLGDGDHPEVAARLEGVRDVVATTPAMIAAVVPCDFSRLEGAAAVRRLLSDGLAFDGIIAASDFIAAGAADALLEAGRRVPEDVAVTGFDDIAVAANNRPRLTSIRQDWSQAGRMLGEAVLALIERPDDFASPDLLPVELIVRESTACVV